MTQKDLTKQLKSIKRIHKCGKKSKEGDRLCPPHSRQSLFTSEELIKKISIAKKAGKRIRKQ